MYEECPGTLNPIIAAARADFKELNGLVTQWQFDRHHKHPHYEHQQEQARSRRVSGRQSRPAATVAAVKSSRAAFEIPADIVTADEHRARISSKVRAFMQRDGARESSQHVPQPVKMFSYHETQNVPHRRTMEDAHIFHPSAAPPLGPRTALVAVLDGHGGSRTALDIVLDHFPAIIGDEMRGHPPSVSGSRRKSIKAAMVGAFARMDQELRPCAWQNGLTATVLLIKRQKDRKSNKDCCTVICANVGDSRAILVAPSGRLTRLTQDHRPTSNAAETDRVVNNGGVVLFGRVGGQLAVSRALGDWCLKNDGVISEPSVSVKREVVQGSIVVAASDGVWDVLGDEEVATFVSMHINEEDVAEKLVSLAVSSGSRDNCCAAVSLI
ncbi:hypothetical protein FOZ63_025880 [Perkinsus olseni]|uniref:PPM-type phosphatase domain-containing protein n=1 Tax=Perkinsus olseni TaxID=32597 RepID=A0A7J6TTT0_PEROL|nr:hypothetical protein FOZ63_025880 [Perkinsus olseni]